MVFVVEFSFNKNSDIFVSVSMFVTVVDAIVPAVVVVVVVVVVLVPVVVVVFIVVVVFAIVDPNIKILVYFTLERKNKKMTALSQLYASLCGEGD